MASYTTIQIPLASLSNSGNLHEIERMIERYAKSLTTVIDSEVKPLTSFRGFGEKNADLKALRRRAMKAKYNL